MSKELQFTDEELEELEHVSALDRLAPILHAEWETRGSKSCITGTWAEDGSVYLLKDVPPQLIDLIVGMQNALSRRYREIQNLKTTLALQTEAFETFLKRG